MNYAEFLLLIKKAYCETRYERHLIHQTQQTKQTKQTYKKQKQNNKQPKIHRKIVLSLFALSLQQNSAACRTNLADLGLYHSSIRDLDYTPVSFCRSPSIPALSIAIFVLSFPGAWGLRVPSVVRNRFPRRPSHFVVW